MNTRTTFSYSTHAAGTLCALLALAVAGCSTPYHKLHDRPDVLPGEVAIITCPGITFGTSPIIREVDDLPGPNMDSGRPMYNSAWDFSCIIEILPGYHTVLVDYSGSTYGTATYASEPRLVDFTAQPGKTYTIDLTHYSTSWDARVVEKK